MTNEQGNFNTFWACKMHGNHASLRCAICDENKLIELQAKVEELTKTLVRMRDEPQATESHYIKLATHALNRAALPQEGTGIQDMMAEVEALSQEGE